MDTTIIEKYYYNTSEPIKVLLKGQKEPIIGYIAGIGFSYSPENKNSHSTRVYFLHQIEDYEEFKIALLKDKKYPLITIKISAEDILAINYIE